MQRESAFFKVRIYTADLLALVSVEIRCVICTNINICVNYIIYIISPSNNAGRVGAIMGQLHGQVRVDYSSARFVFVCPVCGRAWYAGKVPFLCRAAKAISLCEQGRAMGLWQDIFNRSKVKAVSQLSAHINLCTSCGKFVCDDCYSRTNPKGACAKCEKN